MGEQLRAPLKPLNTIVLCWSWGFQWGPKWGGDKQVSRTAVRVMGVVFPAFVLHHNEACIFMRFCNVCAMLLCVLSCMRYAFMRYGFFMRWCFFYAYVAQLLLSILLEMYRHWWLIR